MTDCPECNGSGVCFEFRRFAGEGMAGEPHEVTCPDCEGEGSWPDEDEEGGVSLEEVIVKYGLLDEVGEKVEKELRFTQKMLGDAARAARAVAASRSRRVSPSRPSGLPSTIARKSA